MKSRPVKDDGPIRHMVLGHCTSSILCDYLRSGCWEGPLLAVFSRSPQAENGQKWTLRAGEKNLSRFFLEVFQREADTCVSIYFKGL